MYKATRVHRPSKELLKEKAKEIKLDVTEKELDDCKSVIDHLLESYNEIAMMVEPTLPVKYPRMNPVQPSPKENPYNAWAQKITIEGASSGILKGKTIAIKDCIPIYGVPMKNGSNVLHKYIPDIDATVVTRILDAGGVIKGTTNCEDMCFSGSSFTCCTGPVLNPVDKTRSAGGSSSGSAVAVQLEEVDMALGTDQGGSIRTPASWCGIVGLKPTFGLVPYTGIGSMEPSIDHVGPMAENVKDCALLLQAIAGDDNGLDHRQTRKITPNSIDYVSQLDAKNPTSLTIGVVTEGFVCCDDDVIEAVEEMIKNLQNRISITRISIPIHNDAVNIWSAICAEGAYRTMHSYGGGGTGHKGYYPTGLMEQMSKAFEISKNDMSFTVKPTCIFGKYMQDAYHGRFYGLAQNLITHVTKEYDKALDKVDVLLMPTVCHASPKIPPPDEPGFDLFHHALGMSKNTAPFNSTGHPALSINGGFNKDKLPVGVMIVGRHFDEVKVFQVAKVIEDLAVEA